ncbi:MAG: hypothetical protein V9G19_26790 [Tetrasphaera sp.]
MRDGVEKGLQEADLVWEQGDFGPYLAEHGLQMVHDFGAVLGGAAQDGECRENLW